MKTCAAPISSSTHANHILHEFFSCFHLHEALEEIDTLYKWACKEGYYKKAPPGNLLFLVQFLQKVFTAAELIHFSSGKKYSVLLPPTALQPINPRHYTTSSRADAWQCFPRHLTPEEYLNPYLAFETFTRMPPWEPVLQELLESALSHSSIEGSLAVGKVLRWRDTMMAVIEAAWLIEARN